MVVLLRRLPSMKQPSSVMRKPWQQMFALMMSCLRAPVEMGCQCRRLQDQRPTIKSLGGAVLHPTIEALQLTEIASLNNRVYRTLEVPLLCPSMRRLPFILPEWEATPLSVDNKTYTNRNVKKVEFSIDQRKISLWPVPVTQVSGNAYVIPLLETWKNEI